MANEQQIDLRSAVRAAWDDTQTRYGRLLLAIGKKSRWNAICAAAGLTQTVDGGTIGNPDGSETAIVRSIAPAVTAFAHTRQGLGITVQPLPGQDMDTFTRGARSLGTALGFPAMTAQQDADGTILLGTNA